MWISFVIAALVVLFDQITKLVVELNYIHEEVNALIGDFLYLTKVYNTGAAWSSFSDNTVFLVILSLVSSVLFIYLIIRFVKPFKQNKLLSIASGFILGGTVGNLYDRFLTSIKERKGVIDMIGVRFGSYEFPVFNVADSFLVVGAILLAIDVLFLMEKREGKKNDKKIDS